MLCGYEQARKLAHCGFDSGAAGSACGAAGAGAALFRGHLNGLHRSRLLNRHRGAGGGVSVGTMSLADAGLFVWKLKPPKRQ